MFAIWKDYQHFSQDVRRNWKVGRLKQLLQVLEVVSEEPKKVHLEAYVILLQGCSNKQDLADGKQLHAYVVTSSLKPTVFAWNTIVDMYVKCGSLQDAYKIFERMPVRNVFTWTMLIAGFAQNEEGEEAFELFGHMQLENMVPDKVTFVSVLSGCACIPSLRKGKLVHAHILEANCQSNVVVCNTLIDMYFKTGCIANACQIFVSLLELDVISWNVMITGYAFHGFNREALSLFEAMQLHGIKPDRVTFSSSLSACISISALHLGKAIHAHTLQVGNETDGIVNNAIVELYARSGSLEEAKKVFNTMPTQRDCSLWNIIMNASTQYGDGREAIKVFNQMQHMGIHQNDVTFASVLGACAFSVALEQGRRVHSEILYCTRASSTVVGNALLDMYAKCGSINDAHCVFERLITPDVVSWTAIITGYAQHGNCMGALVLFEKMQQEGVKPNELTLTSILSAFSRACMADECLHYFGSSSQNYNVTLTMQHHVCMVDVLCHAGHFNETNDVMNTLPLDANISLWKSVFNACRIHGNVEMVGHSIKKIVNYDDAFYILLSNVYAYQGMA